MTTPAPKPRLPEGPDPAHGWNRNGEEAMTPQEFEDAIADMVTKAQEAGLSKDTIASALEVALMVLAEEDD